MDKILVQTVHVDCIREALAAATWTCDSCVENATGSYLHVGL